MNRMVRHLPLIFVVILILTQIFQSSLAQARTVKPAVSTTQERYQVDNLTHPYLMFTTTDLQKIKQDIQITGHPRQDMLEAIEAGYLSYYDLNPKYGTDMQINAVAYAITDQPKYFDRARAALLDFVKNVKCWDKVTGGKCERDRTAGINMLKVATTYDLLYQALDPNDRQTVRERLFKEGCKQYEAATWGVNNTQAGWSNWWTSSYTNNHFFSAVSGLAMAGLALEPEKELLGECQTGNFQGQIFFTNPTDWLNYVIDRFNAAKIVLDQIEDGHWPEGDIYQNDTLKEFTVTIFALDTLKGTQYASSPFLKNFPRYYLYDSMPDKRWNNILNNGDATIARRENFRYVKDLRRLASLYGDTLAQGLADKIIADLGGRPKTGGNILDSRIFLDFCYELFYYDELVPAESPELRNLHTSIEATDAEETFMWSTWGNEALVVALHTGPPGGDSAYDIAKSNYNGSVQVGGGLSPQDIKLATGHVQADANGFYLYGNGTYLIPEAAGYGNAEQPWAQSTTAHNTITIAGKDQIGGCPDNTACTGNEDFAPYSNSYYGKGEFWQLSDVAITTYATTQNYDFTVGDATHAYASSEKLEKFTRNIVFIKPGYVVMVDDIRLETAKKVDWYMHTQDGASLEGNWVKGLANNNNLIGIKVLSPNNFSFQTASVTSLADHKLQYLDKDKEIFKLKLSKTSDVPRFITVFQPSTIDTWALRPTINLLAETDDGAVIEVIQNDTSQDRTLVNYGSAEVLVLNNYTTNGKAASISHGSTGQITRFFVAEGTFLSDSTLNTSAESEFSDVLVSHLLPGATFEASYEGTSLTVSGKNLSQFVAYTPFSIEVLYRQTVDENNFVITEVIQPESYQQVGDYLYFNVLPLSKPTPTPTPLTPTPSLTPTAPPATPPPATPAPPQTEQEFKLYLPVILQFPPTN